MTCYTAGIVSTEFVCKCGKRKSWIYPGQRSVPCPECGREYIGKERRERSGVTVIYAEEVVATSANTQRLSFLRSLWNWIIGKNDSHL